MAFADPQSITVNAVAQSMPRISTTGLRSVYQKSDETYKLTISHDVNTQRVRSVYRIDNKAVVSDPLSSINDFETLSMYLVLERPPFGFSETQVSQLWAGFKDAINAAGIITKIYGRES
jgi:hypothetical protein